MAFFLSDGKTIIFPQYFNSKPSKSYNRSYLDTNTHNYLYVLPHNDEPQRLNYLYTLSEEQQYEAVKIYQDILNKVVKPNPINMDSYFQYGIPHSVNKPLKSWQVNDLESILKYEEKLNSSYNNSIDDIETYRELKIYHNKSTNR